MTTKVTVDAHAGWPVKVTRLDKKTGAPMGEPEIVKPGDKRDFYIHGSMDITVSEEKRET